MKFNESEFKRNRDILSKSENANERIKALIYMGQIQTDAALNELIETLKHDWRCEIRFLASLAIASFTNKAKVLNRLKVAFQKGMGTQVKQLPNMVSLVHFVPPIFCR